MRNIQSNDLSITSSLKQSSQKVREVTEFTFGEGAEIFSEGIVFLSSHNLSIYMFYLFYPFNGVYCPNYPIFKTSTDLLQIFRDYT